MMAKWGAPIVLIAIAEAKENWRAGEIKGFAESAFEIALVAPVKKAEVAAINHEPGRAGVGLHHVTEFGVGVFEPGWRMRGDGIHEELIEIGSFKFGVAGFIDLLSELEDFCDILPFYARRHNDWSVWNKVKVVLEIVKNSISCFVLEIGFSDNKNDALTGFNDFAS